MALRISWLLLSFCVLSISVQAADVSFPYVAEIITDDVNVRAGQSENFEALCQLQKGDELIVLGKSYSWYKVDLPKTAESYVSDEFVRKINKDEGEIIGKRVNVRGGPGVIYTVLGQLNMGARVTIVDHTDGWYRIEPIPGSTGWVSEELIAFKSKSIQNFTPTMASVKEKEETAPPKEPEVKPPSSQPVAKDKDHETFKGYLEPQKDVRSKDIAYQLVVAGKPAYYIEGLNRILDDFLYYKVEVQGSIKKDLENRYSYPVIVVSKIQLLL